jgi:hypothetical protein
VNDRIEHGLSVLAASLLSRAHSIFSSARSMSNEHEGRRVLPKCSSLNCYVGRRLAKGPVSYFTRTRRSSIGNVQNTCLCIVSKQQRRRGRVSHTRGPQWMSL